MNQAINPCDVVYTPRSLAKFVVETFSPSGLCLEPCKGSGAFLEFLPPDAIWCEIAEGKDFFNYHGHVDWIVSNPPHSIFDRWLSHSFAVADNVIYLLPFSKVFKSWGTFKKIKAYGGIVRVIAMPSSRAAGFNFGFPLGAFHFKRDYNGPTMIDIQVEDRL